MSAKNAAWLAWSLCAVVVLGTLVSLALALNEPGIRGDAAATANAFLSAFYGVAFGVVGALVLSRIARNSIGWLLMVVGFSIAVMGAIQRLLTGAAGASQTTAAFYWAVWLGSWTWWLLVGPLILLLLLFPTGRLLSPRWRWVVAIGVVLFFAFVAIATASPEWQDTNTGRMLPNPLGTIHALVGLSFDTIQVPWTIALVGTVALSVASVFVRYHRSGAVEREQLKWFMYACAIFIVIYAAAALFVGVDTPGWIGVLLSVSFLLFPLSIGAAILRYRLYDIDIIIRRTLVYIPLTAILAGIFSASIKVTQGLFAGWAGTQSQASTVLTTLLVVAAFDPLKGWLQRAVDARFKGGSGPTQRWLDYGKRVRDLVELSDPESCARRLLQEAAAAFDVHAGAVYLASDGEERTVHRIGPSLSAPEVTVALEHEGIAIGLLQLGPRRGGRSYKADDLALLTENANIVAAAIVLASRRQSGA